MGKRLVSRIDIAERAGSVGSQCLRLHGDASPPREQGAGSLRFVSDGAVWERTAAGPRAGAYRLRGVGRPCIAPWGEGRCKCVRSTLFALRAKALQSGAPDFGVSREKQGFGMFCPSGNFTGAPGNGPMGLFPPGMEIPAVSRTERVLPPGNPNRIILLWCVWRFTRHASLPACFAAKTSGACARNRFSAPTKVSVPPHPPPLYPPDLPAGGNGGLCPHPPKGFIPWESLFGEPAVPQRRRRQAPARGPAAVYSLHRPNRTETQHARPLLVGRACVNTEPKALASDTIGRRLPRRRGRRRSFAGTPQSPSRPRDQARASSP